jgi:hypothetical protein
MDTLGVSRRISISRRASSKRAGQSAEHFKAEPLCLQVNRVNCPRGIQFVSAVDRDRRHAIKPEAVTGTRPMMRPWLWG